MHHFFLTPELINGQQVSFPRDIAHQITHVLRLGEGDQVGVLDNSGMIHQVMLMIDPIEMTVTGIIEETYPVASEPRVHIALYFGKSGREKVEWILQKGTEIGVSASYPFYSSRTLVKPGSFNTKKLERWMRIIREAAEQSGRGRLPALGQPKDLAVFLLEAESQDHLCLIAWETAPIGVESLAEALKGFPGGSIALFVGPEGGFSEEEVSLAINAGCRVVSLGARILRMETAAIVFPALVLYQLGEL